jgi:hypothetical protein
MSELSNKYRHYRIFERDLQESSDEIVARQIDEIDGDALLQEPNGWLHYANQFRVEEHPFCPLIYELHCESWSCGSDYRGLVDHARDWFENGIGFTPTLLASPIAIEDQHEVSGYED